MTNKQLVKKARQFGKAPPPIQSLKKHFFPGTLPQGELYLRGLIELASGTSILGGRRRVVNSKLERIYSILVQYGLKFMRIFFQLNKMRNMEN